MKTTRLGREMLQRIVRSTAGYVTSAARQKNTVASIEEMVREIRAIASTGQCTQQELGEIFGVSQTAVSHIILRKTWAWLND